MSRARAAWLWIGVETAVAVALLELVAAPAPEVRPGVLAALVTGAAYALATVGVATALVGSPPVSSRAALHRALLRTSLLGFLAADEEILWRRLALCELLRWGSLAAWAASAVAFALAHRSRQALHLATGATFGGLYLATGGLAACICAHWSYNLLVGRSAERVSGK